MIGHSLQISSSGIFSALAVSLIVVGVYETCGPEKEEPGGVLVIDNKNFDNIDVDSEPQIVITAEGTSFANRV